jgi:hypothetical protein
MVPVGSSRVISSTAHAFVVAIDRADLPTGQFYIWVNNSDPPQCCAAEITLVSAGQLKSSPINP